MALGMYTGKQRGSDRGWESGWGTSGQSARGPQVRCGLEIQSGDSLTHGRDWLGRVHGVTMVDF